MPDHPLNVAYGKKIEQLREAKGWTRVKLAEKAGLEENSIYKIETAETGITANNLAKISGALGVHPSELFLDDNDAVRAAAAKLVSLSRGDLDWLQRLIKVLEEKVGPSTDS